MDNAELIQVIRTTLESRGDGERDPYRRITQYWSTDGRLLAEVDPMAGWMCRCRSIHPRDIGACPTNGA